MRPIPATSLGHAHGLLRAIDKRGRLRTDEFVTEFSLEELFPPDLENALGRLRHFISYARAAGLVKEDRGVVELTDVGRRYIRAGDAAAPFDISPQQAEWLRRQLREKHMTDSIFHGLAIGLSLLASCPPGRRVSTMDFGRSMAYLGRAGWDNENTLEIQGERHLLLLGDMEMIDGEHRLTPTGEQVRGELTLPVHMSLIDIAAQLNPGGADAVVAAAETEWTAQAAPSVEAAAPPDPPEEENGYHTVGHGTVAPPSEPARPPIVPRSDLPASEPPAATLTPGDPLASSVPPPSPAEEPVASVPPPDEGFATSTPPPIVDAPVVDLPAAEEPSPVAPAPPVAEPPSESPVAPVADASSSVPPPVVEAPAAQPPAEVPPVSSTPPPPVAPVSSSGPAFVEAWAIRAAAEAAGLRLPPGVYANVSAALTAGKHLVLTGAPGAGKTTLALAVARAAAQAGHAHGATVVTAEPSRDLLVEAAGRGRWVIVDELDQADADAALGPLSTFLSGVPVTLTPDKEATAADGWRIVATYNGGAPTAAVLRRFAVIEVVAPPADELRALLHQAADGDQTASRAAGRLLQLAELAPIGAGVFLDAARHAAARNAAVPTDEATLAREAYAAYVAPVHPGLDERRVDKLLKGS